MEGQQARTAVFDQSDSSELSSAPSDFENGVLGPHPAVSQNRKRIAESPDGSNPKKRVKSNRRSRAQINADLSDGEDKNEYKKARVILPTKVKQGKVANGTPKTKKQGRQIAKDELEDEHTIHKEETQILESHTRGTPKAARKRIVKVEVANETESPAKQIKKLKKALAKVEESADEDKSQAATATKPKRHRKTKEEKEAELMPLAARNFTSKILLGAHVSAAGGVHNSITNAHHIGGNAFALFLKSQRKWENPALKTEHSDQFHALCESHKYASKEVVIPHGSYLVNLATADSAKAEQAYNSFLDDLRRCEALGIRLYNFHPGNTNGEPRAEAIGRLASKLNEAHRSIAGVVTLLENMAAQPAGNTLGSTFADLRDVISLITDKSRVGVCLDTCHAFAAGYDLRSPSAFAATMTDFDTTVGLKYLRALHINDSKAPFASHRDLHANIGTGFLGLRAFHNVVNDSRLQGLPMVLETPIDRKDANGKVVEDKGVWAREIKLLESLVGMDAESEEFKRLERELSEQGRAEREKHQEQFDRKLAELAKKAAGGTRRRKKKDAQKAEDGTGVSESGHDSSEED